MRAPSSSPPRRMARANAQIVGRGAVEAAAAHVELGLLRHLERDLDSAVRGVRVHRREARALAGAELERGVVHAERAGDVLAHIGCEVVAGHRLHREAGEVDVDAVEPLLAGVEQQRRGQRLVGAGEHARDVVLGLVALELLAPDVVAEAGGVGEQVAQRDRALRRAQFWLTRVVPTVQHLRLGEPRQHLGDGGIEFELALLDLLQRRDRGDRLGHRGDPDDGVERHRRAGAAGAVGGLEERAVAVAGDRNHARHAAGSGRCAQLAVQLCQ